MNIEDNVYSQMQKMAELTIKMILSGNLIRSAKLIAIVEHLFLKGNYQTRNAVANVYIYNVSAILELHHCNLQKLFPQSLQAEYIKQSNAF